MSNKAKILISSGIANTFEWYDYALFGNLATIIGRKFFPNESYNESMLSVFAVFAAGYLMRPIGGIFFGFIGDRYGRKFALSLAVLAMSVPIAIIGLLPTYDEIGVFASILMVIMRMIQGISVGGALTGSISFLIEHTDKKSRGAVSSIPMMSICLGILLGTLVSVGTQSLMTVEDFENYGWRIPFLIGVLTAVAGYYINNYTEETPLFKELKENGDLENNPIQTVLKNHWFDMLMSIFINSTGSVIFYLQAVYISNFLKTQREFSFIAVDKLSAVSFSIMAVCCVMAGWLSDYIGRVRIFILVISFTILSIFNITWILQNGDWGVVILAQILLGVIAASYIGPEPALQAEFYPTNIRSTALSLSYNIATSIFGGTTPFLITYLYIKTGSLSGCGIYVIITSIFSLIGLYFYKNRMDI